MPNRNETPERNPFAHNNLCAASPESRKHNKDSAKAYANYQKPCANRCARASRSAPPYLCVAPDICKAPNSSPTQQVAAQGWAADQAATNRAVGGARALRN